MLVMSLDPELYCRSHSVQMKDANKLLDWVLPEMSFGEDDVVMDMGCGSGDNTRDVLLPRIPKLEKLIAIDVSPKMIEFARRNTSNPKIEFGVADIEDKNSLKQWEGSIANFFSFHCFHWLKDQKRAFGILYFLLQTKGEAALVFTLSNKLWDCYPTLIKDVKWNKYLKDVETYVPESHHLNFRSEYFRRMLKESGFEVLKCRNEERSYVFRSDADFSDTVRAISPLESHVPEVLSKEFTNDFIREVFKVFPRNNEGLAVFSYEVLTVHIRKP